MYSLLTKFLFGSILLCCSYPVHAQLYQSGRFELPITDRHNQYEVIPANKQGTVLLRRVSYPKSDQFEIIHTDTSFQQKWKGYIPIERNLVLADKVIHNDQIILFLYRVNLQDRNFILYHINLKTSHYYTSEVRNVIPFVPTAIKTTINGAIISGYLIRVPVILFYNFQTQSSRILPGLLNEAGELSQIRVNNDNTFDVLILARNYQKQKSIWIKSYTSDGNLIRNQLLKPDYPFQFQFATTMYTPDNNQIIAGVFGKSSEYARGIFISHIQTDGSYQTYYYNFAEMENFFKYLKASKEARMKQKIERKKIKGRQINLHYRFLVHEFVPYKNNFLLLGEAFRPQYKTVEGPDPLRVGNTRQVFDGYKYTHAVILGIDPQGQLLWDNSFEMNDIKTYSLEQFVKMNVQADDITLLYLFDEKIRTKIIQDNRVVEGKSFNTLQTKSPGLLEDEITILGKLDYWYDKYFIAYGVEDVPYKTDGKTRRVFFLTKVYYQ